MLKKAIAPGGPGFVLLALSSFVSAAPLYDTFGPLDRATFGGAGIPNNEVAISSQFSNGASLITAAMSASQRYDNPALTNDGAGTYFAGAGTSLEGPSLLEGALWNFNFFIDIESTSGETLADYDITLYYDFDPAFDDGPSGLGTINITNGILAGPDPATTLLVEGSENLLFDFLATGIPGLINAPGGTFNPTVPGEYNCGISVGQDGWGVENVRMDVQVVPIPAAARLFVPVLFGLVAVKRRKA